MSNESHTNDPCDCCLLQLEPLSDHDDDDKVVIKPIKKLENITAKCNTVTNKTKSFILGFGRVVK